MTPSTLPEKAESPGLRYTLGQRLILLGLNYITLAQALLVVALFVWPWPHVWERIGTAAAALYLTPPLFTRLLFAVLPVKQGTIALGSRDFFVWWASFNFQGLYSRLPMLEELLRIVPGLYSTWLRLWGAKIGRLTYWGAGTKILDRPFIKIGRDVVFGAGVNLSPHAFTRSADGDQELELATVKVGDRALVGGHTLLSPGSEIAEGECTHAFLICQPYVVFKNGRRQKPKGTDAPKDRFLDWLQQ